MSQVHPDILSIFVAGNPGLHISDVISYDATHGTFLDANGNKMDYKFPKYNPTNLLAGVVPSAFVAEGTSYNDAIEKALGYSFLKSIKGIDYDYPGTVSFNGSLEKQISVPFSQNSPVYSGRFTVKFYNADRSGINNLTPGNLTGKITIPDELKIKAIMAGTIFTSDIAVLQNNYLSTTWIDAIIERLNQAGIPTTNTRDILTGKPAYKVYADTYSDLVDINYNDTLITLRYQGPTVTPPLITYIELPTV